MRRRISAGGCEAGEDDDVRGRPGDCQAADDDVQPWAPWRCAGRGSIKWSRIVRFLRSAARARRTRAGGARKASPGFPETALSPAVVVTGGAGASPRKGPAAWSADDPGRTLDAERRPARRAHVEVRRGRRERSPGSPEGRRRYTSTTQPKAARMDGADVRRCGPGLVAHPDLPCPSGGHSSPESCTRLPHTDAAMPSPSAVPAGTA